ncbi:MAG: hypothetical protein A4E42_00244 [Methanoregulaceae archaeon PtaU1.Bin222]|nr:MAG: hypothetical protein A4E42_00244 [Methanoregulaceae archaeon PtaU1.Bin222]
MILYRGPQFTHEVHQYSSYLPPGVVMSDIHWSQMAISGGIIPEREPARLGRIEKSSGKGPASSNTSTRSIRDNGGPCEISLTNSSNRSPDARISTSLPRFVTVPRIPRLFAAAYTKGRKPTPCTIPRICILPLLCMPFKQRFIDLSLHIILGFYQ